MDNWRKDFPLKDSYQSADGHKIEFDIRVNETPAGYLTIAEEIPKSKGERFGY